jgi:hypothetical protein
MLVYDPGPAVERLMARLDMLAEGEAGYPVGVAHDYLVNAGLELWEQLIPDALRRQFWERQDRITQLTILSDADTVPWELLYPKDPGHEAGFLVEQFPVTRAVFGRRPSRSLRLRPARFVLPDGSPRHAQTEVQALRSPLDPGSSAEVVHTLAPLLDLIRRGDFGLLHFACHNRFDLADGSTINLDCPFLPMHSTRLAAIRPWRFTHHWSSSTRAGARGRSLPTTGLMAGPTSSCEPARERSSAHCGPCAIKWRANSRRDFTAGCGTAIRSGAP